LGPPHRVSPPSGISKGHLPGVVYHVGPTPFLFLSFISFDRNISRKGMGVAADPAGHVFVQFRNALLHKNPYCGAAKTAIIVSYRVLKSGFFGGVIILPFRGDGKNDLNVTNRLNAESDM
jgi:hypothetical protein